MNFWQQLYQQKKQTGKPFFTLAPMADVTDAVFRSIICDASRHGQTDGGPDVIWTEFVSADGLAHPVGREKLMLDLQFSEAERPIVAQLFSSNPENMRIAAQLCAELGFDGIDINMGCPDKTIEKQGCGSAMIKTPEKAVAVIRAAKQGVIDAGKEIPVSVKTRVGYYTETINEWIPVLLGENIAALTIHARTRKDLSKVPANWNYVKRVVALRDKLAPETVIIGNGDVVDITDGIKKATETGCDGIMIGRAVFGNPWIFDHQRTTIQKGNWRQSLFLRLLPNRLAKKIMGDKRYTVSNVTLDEKLAMMIRHTELFRDMLGHQKNFSIMKKHYKAYAHGFPGAKELRIQLMESTDYDQAIYHIQEFIKKHL